jgi:hypothetical protein
LSKLKSSPLRIICGISKSGIITYTVTAELKAEEIFNPSTLAKHEVVKRINQNGRSMLHSISRMKLPIRTNEKVCTAESVKSMKTFDVR